MRGNLQQEGAACERQNDIGVLVDKRSGANERLCYMIKVTLPLTYSGLSGLTVQERVTVLDLFCGAGGMALGFVRAGFTVVCAVDNSQVAVDTYNANLGQHAVACDLGKHTDLPATTVIVGGPPCQGFSSAGLRKNGDYRNTLVSRFAEIVVLLRPVAFVFENVEGFITAENGAHVLDLLLPLIRAGYRIHLRKVNAANYGVPQHRKRVIAIGGLGWNPDFPLPTHAAYGAPGAELSYSHLPTTPTLMDALRGMPAPVPVESERYSAHSYRPLSGIDLERAHALQPGQSMRDLPTYLWHESFRRRAFRRVKDGMPTERRGGAPFGVRRLVSDEPCKAITGGARAEFLHPFEDRNLTIRELARIQTFPDGFAFRGTVAQQEQLIGNAVPPSLASVIAHNLALDLKTAEVGCQAGTLLSFVPTLSTGMSPVLAAVTRLVHSTFDSSPLRESNASLARRYTLHSRSDTRPAQQLALWKEDGEMALTQAQRAIIAKARAIGGGQQGVALDDATCAYLIAVIADDLGLLARFPEFPNKPASFFETSPLSSLRLPVSDFMALFQRLVELDPNTDTYFSCLATLHKSRLKYERILQTQPIPTIDQVGPRGLLQYGSLSAKALAGFLFWRKWMFDIDNRAGQETGYLFEPIIANAIGGTPVGTKRSPVYRDGDTTKGQRQVDCIRDDKAYEFKLRVTIAASGQGRWQEELDFPRDCLASGFTPVLIVLDPTRNTKLNELEQAFLTNNGEAHIEDAWAYLDGLAGQTMSTFLERYVHDPIRALLNQAPKSEAPEEMELPELALSMSKARFTVSVAGEMLEVNRSLKSSGETQADAIPDDADDQLPG